MATVVVFEDKFEVIVFGIFTGKFTWFNYLTTDVPGAIFVSNPCEPTTKDPLIPGALFWQTHGQALASCVGSTLEGELLGDFCFFLVGDITWNPGSWLQIRWATIMIRQLCRYYLQIWLEIYVVYTFLVGVFVNIRGGRSDLHHKSCSVCIRWSNVWC